MQGFGSIFDLWPPPTKLKEISPDDATEMIRKSWQDVGDALWEAMGVIEVEIAAEEAETATAESEIDRSGVSEHR